MVNPLCWLGFRKDGRSFKEWWSYISDGDCIVVMNNPTLEWWSFKKSWEVYYILAQKDGGSLKNGGL
jgi:hypothetical protein